MKANHKQISRYIQIARGQLDGVLKMIENDEYCVDVSNQILATISLLKKANTEILSAHLTNCFRECPSSELEEKVDEIKKLIDRMTI
ncbi:MAG TPA: transcriptional regulator [Firmicutes bacterium]|nr:transcriptional regulator [Bacillota bacterium]HBM69910.1 transcriptional regulator [Bacillota bacterium]HBX25034.1 transcriptional regulator [Bacillota bacterium]